MRVTKRRKKNHFTVANWVFAQITDDVGRTSELDLLLGYRVKINVHQQRPSIHACIFITVHKGIVNRYFQAEFAKSDKNLHIIKNLCIGSNQILYNDKDREMVFLVFQTRITNPRWRTVAILSINSHISAAV